MHLERYIVVPAIKTRENELIPIWDPRISYYKHEMYGKQLKVEGERDEYSDLVEVVYDLKTRTLSTGIDLDYYPEKTEFVADEEVYVEDRHSAYYESKIKEVKFENFDLSIVKGNKLHGYFGKRFEDIETTKDQIYAVKYWKPTYVLINGEVIEWEHELKKKVAGPTHKKR